MCVNVPCLYVCVCVCVTCLCVCALEKILNFICIANRAEQNLKLNARNRIIAINTAIIRYARETYAQFKDKSITGEVGNCNYWGVAAETDALTKSTPQRKRRKIKIFSD